MKSYSNIERTLFVTGVCIQIVVAVLLTVVAMDERWTVSSGEAKLVLGLILILSAGLSAVPVVISKQGETADNRLPERIVAVLYVLLIVTGTALWWTSGVAIQSLPQAIGTIFAGCAAISAAFLAYSGAMAKVTLDKEHKEQDIRRHYVARNLHAIRVARFNMDRVASLLRGLHTSESLALGHAKFHFELTPVRPSGGLIECLNNAAELESRILVQLHRLYNTLETCDDLIRSYKDEHDNLQLRNEHGWTDEGAVVLDKCLRRSFDICRVVIALGKEVVGTEHRLTEEEFNALRDSEQDVEDIPAAIAFVETNQAK